jgi:hypothetical protein
MAGGGGLLPIGDGVVGQAGEVVVGLVVEADVVDAEVVILALVATTLRRRMRARGLASAPVAGREAALGHRVRVRADADALEEVGFVLHRRIMVSRCRGHKPVDEGGFLAGSAQNGSDSPSGGLT